MHTLLRKGAHRKPFVVNHFRTLSRAHEGGGAPLPNHQPLACKFAPFIFNGFQDAPPATRFFSCSCIVARGWHHPPRIGTPRISWLGAAVFARCHGEHATLGVRKGRISSCSGGFIPPSCGQPSPLISQVWLVGKGGPGRAARRVSLPLGVLTSLPTLVIASKKLFQKEVRQPARVVA